MSDTEIPSLFYIPETIDVNQLNLDTAKIAKMVDHTKLNAFAKKADIVEICEDALEYSFGAVCINQIHVKLCAELLENSETEICTVVGFPLGASYSSIKASEADLALSDGATEIDMVINIQKVRDGDWDAAYADVNKVVETVKGRGVTKVIFETGYLTREEIVQTCKICEEAGADYVKTSTGFGVMGATYDHVKLMRHTVGDRMKIKAAGGIKDFKSAMYMVKAGADRLGTSAGVAIIEGLSWLKYTSSWLNNPNPCYHCPSRMAPFGKMSGSTYKYYKSFCNDCPNKAHNIFND